ncbi:hypothetical protein ACJX0J_014853 [Zea mays]
MGIFVVHFNILTKCDLDIASHHTSALREDTRKIYNRTIRSMIKKIGLYSKRGANTADFDGDATFFARVCFSVVFYFKAVATLDFYIFVLYYIVLWISLPLLPV